jgi:hypothetical protein
MLEDLPAGAGKMPILAHPGPRNSPRDATQGKGSIPTDEPFVGLLGPPERALRDECDRDPWRRTAEWPCRL